MLNKYPLWKYLLILLVVILAAIYASPVLFSENPALQITGKNASVEVTESTVRRIKNRLQQSDIEYSVDSFSESAVVLNFNNKADQDQAKYELKKLLFADYIIALNQTNNTPKWLKDMGAKPMKRGLDLRGGVHFLLEVDITAAVKLRLKSAASAFRVDFGEKGLKYRIMEVTDQQTIVIKFDDPDAAELMSEYIRRNGTEYTAQRNTDPENLSLTLSYNDAQMQEIRTYAITQNLVTLKNRVNELGVAEPLVQRQGASRIIVELPGIQDTAVAKRIIGRTASLEFRLEDWKNVGRTAVTGPVPVGSERFPYKENRRPPVLVKKSVIVSGDRVVNAQSTLDESSMPQVSITLDNSGGKRMHSVTKKHIGKKMVVIFIEYKTELKEVLKNGVKELMPVTSEEKYVINVATIKDALGFKFRITGLDSMAEASELALLLRAGALAAPMYFVEERTVGPSLGKENIAAGLASIQFGFFMVMIFMIVYYRVFGLIANVALSLNLIMLVAVMSLIDATLTLPGMAGFVLLVGIAVDNNVIIFSRIKEELAAGESPQGAISAGYDKAFTAIIDANLTTIAVASVLLFASGSVKGFAVTLLIGIMCSLFTSVVVTRALVNLIYGNRKLTSLTI